MLHNIKGQSKLEIADKACPALPGLADRSVLLIDDAPMVLDILSSLINELGWQCRSAPNGAKGLAAFERQPTRIVITDLWMPAASGIMVAWAIKRRSPQTMVVLHTGDPSVLPGNHLRKIGIDMLWHKPVGLEQINLALQEAA